MIWDDAVKLAANRIEKSEKIVFLTGAGISIDSGIPAFRGYQGLWESYDPFEYAHIDSFLRDPEKVWHMLFEMFETLLGAEPNNAHKTIARLGDSGRVTAVITQNIDGLHQKAGSRVVVEYHGNAFELVCIYCGSLFNTLEKLEPRDPPCCSCGKILKPKVTFFGEPIEELVNREAQSKTMEADLFIIIGTSATVYPANQLPFIAHRNRAGIIVINPEMSPPAEISEAIWFAGGAVPVLNEIMKYVNG